LHKGNRPLPALASLNSPSLHSASHPFSSSPLGGRGPRGEARMRESERGTPWAEGGSGSRLETSTPIPTPRHPSPLPHPLSPRTHDVPETFSTQQRSEGLHRTLIPRDYPEVPHRLPRKQVPTRTKPRGGTSSAHLHSQEHVLAQPKGARPDTHQQWRRGEMFLKEQILRTAG